MFTQATVQVLLRAATLGLMIVITALLMAACGGGSNTPPSNGNPVAGLSVSTPLTTTGTIVTLDASTSSDPDGDPLTYAWELSAPTGSLSAIVNTSTARPTFTPDVAGTYAVTLTVSDGRAISAPTTATIAAASPPTPEIVLDAAEPLSGVVQLSISNAVTGTVSWYVDLQLLGAGNTGPTAPITWNTAQVANGSHLIVARIQRPTGTTDEIRRTVSIANSSINLSASTLGTSGTIAIDARASSAFGITSVSISLDGRSASTLTAPNACGSRSCSGNDIYRFNFDAVLLGSGAHTAVVTAMDGTGATRQVTVSAPISNAPTIDLAGPLDGALLTGSLRVSGTAFSDKTGTLTVTAVLGSLEVLRTTARAFSSTFDLAGVIPGIYSLTVRATDVDNLVRETSRSVVVTSTSVLADTPVFSLPAGGSLLGVEGSSLLYAQSDGGVVVRNIDSGVEVQLARSAQIQYDTDWKISGGRVYVQGKDTDCNVTFVCVYEWLPDGSMTNLTRENQAASGYQVHPVAKGGFVVWANDTNSYTVYRASTRSFTQVPLPAGANYVGNNSFDIAVSGNVVQLIFWAQNGGNGTTSAFDVYQWRSDTGSTIRVTSNGLRNVYTQTDSLRAAWQQTPLGGGPDGTFTLMTAPVAGGVAIAASSNALLFLLRDGVLAWVERTATTRALKASTAASSVTLSTTSTSNLLDNGGGQVLYADQGKVYSWNSATGASTLRVDAEPTQAFVTGSALVFRIGPSVYRVALP